jgi:hypothetical protein
MQLHIPGTNINSLPYEPAFSLAKSPQAHISALKKTCCSKSLSRTRCYLHGRIMDRQKEKTPGPLCPHSTGPAYSITFLAPDQKRKFPFRAVPGVKQIRTAWGKGPIWDDRKYNIMPRKVDVAGSQRIGNSKQSTTACAHHRNARKKQTPH